MPGVFGPHGCEYLLNGTKVLFHRPLLDGGSAGFQKASAHALVKIMEEKDRVPDDLEVGWYLQPLAELVPLVPGDGVFLGCCGG